MWYSFLQFWARIVFPVVFRIRAYGRENVPSGGPVILAANHQSFLDPPLVGVGLTRQVHYMARKGLFRRWSPFTWLIESLNAFPVDRRRGDISAVRETLRRLKAGAAVLAFPEGTRSRGGRVGAFKAGIFMIAARSGAPVVPTAIAGADKAWPPGALFPRPATVHVAFGRALYARDFSGDADRMMKECRDAVVALCARTQARKAGVG